MRRARVLATSLVCVAAPSAWLWLAPSSAASHAGDPNFEIQTLRENVHLIRGGGANCVVLAEPAGLVIVDTKFAEHAAALRDALTSIRPVGLRYVIATHHHVDTIGAIATLTEHDPAACTVAHEQTDARARELGPQRPGARAGFELAFRSRLTLRTAGGETITLHHKGRGHTDGDCVVHFANARVLAVGGLVADRVHPRFLPEEGGDLRDWIRTLEQLARDFDGQDVLVVPGHGAAGGIELLHRQAEYLRDIVEHMDHAHRDGFDRDEALRTARPLREKYANYTGDGFEDLLRAAYRRGGSE